jgi:hypothetical protein
MICSFSKPPDLCRVTKKETTAMQEHRDNPPEKDDASGGLMSQAIRLLASRALTDPDPLTRKHAIYLLGMARNPDDIDTFVRALRDPEKEVRSQATRALAMMGEPALGELISLLKDPDWKIRYRAAEALGMMKREEAREPLVARLSDSEDHVRYMAVKSLGELGQGDSLDAVRPCLLDQNPYVRKMAATVLEKHSS